MEGWLRYGTPKALKAAKKKFFKQLDTRLCYFDDESMQGPPQGTLSLLDVINVFAEGKAKQGVFMVLTQTESWRLQAVGDDLDAVRDRWITSLEAWLMEHRPGYKKLKKMGAMRAWPAILVGASDRLFQASRARLPCRAAARRTASCRCSRRPCRP